MKRLFEAVAIEPLPRSTALMFARILLRSAAPCSIEHTACPAALKPLSRVWIAVTVSDVPAVASRSAMRCKIAPSDSGETESLDCSFRKSEIICVSDLTSIAIRKAPVARFMVNRFMSLPQKYGYRLGGEKTGKLV